MPMKTLSKLRGNRIGPDGQEFAWGPIVRIHEIGDFAIVEYREDNSSYQSGTEQDRIDAENHGRTQYHLYNRKPDDTYGDLSLGTNTLDEALAVSMAHKYDGMNSRAGYFFLRMIGDKVHQDWPR